ncbi:MAG: hypothetical protein JKY31_09175, partial [Rhodobacteraceae bacterium]|nr:hypothetical protein [Paracoccaceae bacterium]
APQTAARPPRRPRNLRIPDPVEVEPDTLEEDAILAAIWQAEADAAEAAANAPQPAAELTGVERAAIGDAIEWNSVAFSGQENIEDYVIVVSVDVDSTGLILRETIELLEPASPTGLYTIIYRDARIGIIRSERIPLPAGQYPNGATLHLRFNPASGAVGIN